MNLNDGSDGKTATLRNTVFTNLEVYLNSLLEVPDPKFDAVVDLSGSENYSSVQEAVARAPENKTSPWAIFINNLDQPEKHKTSCPQHNQSSTDL
ncbi:hypothetical protein GCM10027051_25190 [Niabella terrae]